MLIRSDQRICLGFSLFVFGLPLALLGCGERSGAVLWHARDSAGIHIVEHEPPPSLRAPSWHLAVSPFLDIEQGTEADDVWTMIRRVFRWEDGRIGVLVTDAPYLRVFDSDGVPLMQLGMRGEGPGEVRGGLWAGALGDSAVILDRSRFVIYDADGKFVRNVTVVAPFTSFEVLGSSDRGWIAATRRQDVDDHTGPAPAPRTLGTWSAMALSSDGSAGDMLARFQQMLTYAVHSALWQRLTHAAAGGGRIHVLDPNRYEIRSYENGAVVRVTRAPVPRLPEFTEAHFDATRDAWGAIADRMIARGLENGTFAMPPAVTLLVTDEGWLWIRRTDDGPLAESRTWDVFEDRGVWTATIDTDPHFIIHEVRGDEVLGVWYDDFDVTTVRAYRFDRN